MDNKITQDTLLETMDVPSLYTNIPNQNGIDAVAAALYTHRPESEIPYNSSPSMC